MDIMLNEQLSKRIELLGENDKALVEPLRLVFTDGEIVQAFDGKVYDEFFLSVLSSILCLSDKHQAISLIHNENINDFMSTLDTEAGTPSLTIARYMRFQFLTSISNEECEAEKSHDGSMSLPDDFKLITQMEEK